MATNVRNGPEFAPLRYIVNNFPIVVTIYDSKDNVIREEKMNFGDSEDRKWLGKLSYWAMEQGHVVQTEKDTATKR